MQSLALRTSAQIKFFYFFGWARPEFTSLWGGPAHSLQASSCQENYLWITLIFILWDKLGYAIPAASPVCWDPVQNSNQHKNRKRGHMQLKDNIEKTEERKNRFNGESVMLTAEEARRHDNIFINELAATLEDQEAGIDGHSEKWKAVRRDLDWFRQHNASAYMVLLD